jgi:hypothetical protein
MLKFCTVLLLTLTSVKKSTNDDMSPIFLYRCFSFSANRYSISVQPLEYLAWLFFGFFPAKFRNDAGRAGVKAHHIQRERIGRIRDRKTC